MFFDDFPVGYRYRTGERALPLDEILAFARQWDPQPFHIDPEAAARSPYGGIIASGFHTLVTSFLLTYACNLWNEASMGASGISDLEWLRPVRPGDRLRVEAEVIGSTPSRSRPDRGRTEIRYEVFNQDDEKVMQYQAMHLLRRRPPD